MRPHRDFGNDTPTATAAAFDGPEENRLRQALTTAQRHLP
jgi:hypothetical protein